MLMLQGTVDAGTSLGWFAQQLRERWYFLVIFAAWGIYVGRLIWRARREAAACRAWVKGKPRPDSQVVGELQLFVNEAERWRLEGVAVPMTDYSDRVDSIIEGIADRLHSAVNLFLIIGLAGTFFGMAEFARQASALERTSDPAIILNALRAALGHSFPVGFLGLVLTALGHPIASMVEGRLREAAAAAVNQALRQRNAAIRKADSDAIVQALAALPAAMAGEIKATNASLVTQFQALFEIPEAIKKANQESLEPLRLLIAESQKHWQTTVATDLKRMADAVDRLEQPIQRLTVKIDDIGGLVASTQQVVSHVLADAGKVSAMVEELQKRTDQTAQSLSTAADELRTAPEAVKKDLLSVHQDAIAAIRAYFEGLGRTYADSVRQLADASVGQIAQAVRDTNSNLTTATEKYVQEMRQQASATSGELSAAAHTSATSLTTAAQNLQMIANTIDQQLKDAISAGAGALGAHLKDFNDAFQQQFPKAVADLQAALAQASQRMETARAVLEGMTTASQHASAQTEEWKKVGAVLRESTATVTRALTALQGAVDKSRAQTPRNGQRNGLSWRWWPLPWPRRSPRKEV